MRENHKGWRFMDGEEPLHLVGWREIDTVGQSFEANFPCTAPRSTNNSGGRRGNDEGEHQMARRLSLRLILGFGVLDLVSGDQGAD
jgi:hypothetical protein